MSIVYGVNVMIANKISMVLPLQKKGLNRAFLKALLTVDLK